MDHDRVLFREELARVHPRRLVVAATLGLCAIVVFACAMRTAPAALAMPIGPEIFWLVVLTAALVWVVLAAWSVRSTMCTLVRPGRIEITCEPLHTPVRRIDAEAVASTTIVRLAEPDPPDDDPEAPPTWAPAPGRGCHRGVLLALANGRTVFIGSNRPDELSQAIHECKVV